MIRQSNSASRPNRLANRKASPVSKQSLAHAFRVMAPTLVALTFASVAHAQGTMDFSGAQTLMGTFNTVTGRCSPSTTIQLRCPVSGTLILCTLTTPCLQSQARASMGAVRYAHRAHAG